MKFWGVTHLVVLGGLLLSTLSVADDRDDREVLYKEPATNLIAFGLEGVSPTEKKKFSLTTPRFWLKAGEHRRFTFDQKVYVHQVILHVESYGSGPSAFGIYANGQPSLEYKVPPCDPEYHIDIQKKAWGFNISSTGTTSQYPGVLQVNWVEVEVSPLAIYQTPAGREKIVERIIERRTEEGKSVRIKFPDYRWTPMSELSENVEDSCSALRGHFNLKQQGCFIYRVKKEAILAKAKAKGLGDANIHAATTFRRLLEELDCAAPLFDDGIERDYAAGEVGEVVEIRELIRRNLGYPGNTCPISRLKDLVKKRCADADYIDSLLAKYDEDAAWMRQWSDDSRREREARKAYLEEVKARIEAEEATLDVDPIDENDADIKVEVTVPGRKAHKRRSPVEVPANFTPPQTKSPVIPAAVTPSTDAAMNQPVAGLPMPRPATDK